LFGFGFVGNEVGSGAELGEVDRRGGSGIDDAGDAVGGGELHGVVDGGERDFELQDDGGGLLEKRGGGVDVGGRERVVGAFDDDDAILAAGFDEDGCDAGGDAVGDADVGGVNAERFEILDGGGAEQVGANFGDHGDACATKFGGDGLVGAFAAEAEVEFLAEDGFAGTRETVVEGGEVDVGGAHDGDEGWSRHGREL